MVVDRQLKTFSNLSLYESRLNRNIARNEQRLQARQAERRAAFEQALEEARILQAAAVLEAAENKAPEPDLAATLPNEFRLNGFVFSSQKIIDRLDYERRLHVAKMRLRPTRRAA